MARRFGHHATGVGAAMIAYAVVYGCKLDYGWFAAIAAYSGSSAPDWLEIPNVKKGWFGGVKRDGNGDMIRTSVIPHRTITHWLPAWIAFFVMSLIHIHDNFLWGTGFGFALGGLVHLLVDIPNPMGIPIFSPFHRYKLEAKFGRKKVGQQFGWWKSGEWDVALALVFSGIGYISLKFVGAVS